MALKGVVNILHIGGTELPPTDPRVTGAVSVADDKVRVSFDQSVKASDAGDPNDALNPANYVFTSGLGINRSAASAVVVQGAPTIVEVTLTGEMTDGVAYEAVVSNVENKFGMGIDPNANTADFTGQGTDPQVNSATAISVTQVEVEFNEIMRKNIELTTPGNYVFAGDTVITAAGVSYADAAGKTTVTITITGEMRTGGSYTVSVSTNVEDESYNPVDTGANSAGFSGVGQAPRVLPAAQSQDSDKVRMYYNEAVQEPEATDPANYSIVNSGMVPLAVSAVTKINDTTYDLTTAVQSSGEDYTITVDTSVKDLAGNTLDPAFTEAEFVGQGVSPPLLSMIPASGSDGVDPRMRLQVTAVDDADEFTGIDTSSWWLRIEVGGLTTYVILGGVAQPGFDVQFSGDPLTTEGITASILPSVGRWEANETYTVTSFVQDLEGAPNDNALIGDFTTDEFLCAEDDLPDPTATDLAVMSPLSSPNCEKLRSLFLEACSSSPSLQARARSLMTFAASSDIKAILAGLFDFSLVTSIKLCDRRRVTYVKNILGRYPRLVPAAIDEVPTLKKEARNLLLDYHNSSSMVYSVSAAAATVVLCALLES